MNKKPLEIDIKILEIIIEKYLLAGANVNYALKIVGHPGIGKSALVKQMAQKNNFFFVETRLAFKENVDLGGYPVPDHKKERMIYYRPSFIPPLQVPKGYQGIVWFLDEANRAHPSVIQTLFQIITEKRCGEHQLSQKTFIILAGNLGEDDKTIITDFDDSALEGRLASFHLKPEPSQWLTWASLSKIHPSVIKYISLYPEKLWEEKNIDPNPRGWHQVSQTLIRLYKLLDEEKLKSYLKKQANSSLSKVVAALIGEITAQEFFLEIITPRQISTKEILKGDSKKLALVQKNKISNEDLLWALSGAISFFREKNILLKNKFLTKDLEELGNTLKFMALIRADARLSFFYLLIKEASLFSQIPKALKKIKSSELQEKLIKNFSSLF